MESIGVVDDLDAGLLGEVLEHLRVDIVGPVVDVDDLVLRRGRHCARCEDRGKARRGQETLHVFTSSPVDPAGARRLPEIGKTHASRCAWPIVGGPCRRFGPSLQSACPGSPSYENVITPVRECLPYMNRTRKERGHDNGGRKLTAAKTEIGSGRRGRKPGTHPEAGPSTTMFTAFCAIRSSAAGSFRAGRHAAGTCRKPRRVPHAGARGLLPPGCRGRPVRGAEPARLRPPE